MVDGLFKTLFHKIYYLIQSTHLILSKRACISVHRLFINFSATPMLLIIIDQKIISRLSTFLNTYARFDEKVDASTVFAFFILKCGDIFKEIKLVPKTLINNKDTFRWNLF